jgi:two-component system cell cycle sensor histidine kinase/response regulator CckA
MEWVMNKVLRLLLVEDSELDARLLENEIKRAGYAIKSLRVDTRKEFLSALESPDWDLILCDYYLLDFNAMTAIELFRKRELDIPFIVVSALIGEETAVETMKAGADDYVMKGNLKRLVPAIERELREADVRRERKREETALRESQLRFSRIFDASPIPITLCRLTDDRYVDVNESFLTLGGFTREEVIGHTTLSLGVYPNAAMRTKIIEELRQHGKCQVNDQPFRTKSGKIIDTRLWLEVLPLPDVQLVLAIALDVTKSKRAEESLKLFRALIDQSSDAIEVIDPETAQFLDSNVKASADLGYTAEELRSLKVFDVDPTVDQHSFAKAIAELRKSRFMEWQGLHRRKDGSTFPVEVHMTYVQLDRDYVVTAVRDITKRRRSEEALRKSETKYRSIFENVQDVFYLTDLKGVIIDISPSIKTNSGYTREELIGKNVQEVYYFKEDRENLVEELSKEGEVRDCEVRLKTKDGRMLYASVNCHIVYDSTHNPTSVEGTVKDVTARTKAEIALRNSEEQFRTLTEFSPTGTYLIQDNVFRHVNPSLAKLFGYTVEEVIDRLGPLDLTTPEDRPRAEENVRKRIEGVTPYVHYSFRGLRKDGNSNEVEAYGARVDYKGRPAIIGTLIDVTERNQISRALNASEQKYRDIFQFAPVGIYQADRHGRLLTANATFAKILGYESESDVVGLNMAEAVYFDPEERERLIRRYEPAGFGNNIEILWKRKDGSPIWISTTFRTKKGRDGGIQYFDGFILDIDDRKRSEAQLKRLAHAIRSISECVSITDMEDNILFVNRAFLNTYGYEESELIGQSISLVRSQNNPSEKLKEILPATLRRGWQGDLFNKRKDGTEFPIFLSSSIIRDEDGRASALVGVATDISQRIREEKEKKELEKQLVQAQKMESIGTLAGGIAHDFNNILGIILGHASLIKESNKNPVLVSSSIDTITKAVQRGASLVRQILTFARKTEMTRESVDLNALVMELTKMLQQTFPRTIEIATELDESIRLLAIDQTQLQQAIMNLCVNARDAMVEGSNGQLPKGLLKIRTSQISGMVLRSKFADASDSEYVCLEVTDTGIGMNESTKKKMFEPFFTTKELGKGTGLGLAVVYGVITGHHGFIDVESEPGKGTTFRVYLPQSSNKVVALEQSKPEDKSLSKGSETILVIEDEENLLDLMTTILVRSGYTVISARDGVEAIERFEKHRKEIALVLTDMGLPKLDGSEVVSALILRDPNVKVILASGYLEPQLKSELLKSGARDFVQKPYVPEEVLKKIRQVLDLKQGG